MELHTPLALDQGRRCQTLEAVQNTVEEVPHTAYCGDTAKECVKTQILNKMCSSCRKKEREREKATPPTQVLTLTQAFGVV